MKRMTKLFTALALAFGLTTAAQAETSTPVFLLNFVRDQSGQGEVWYNHTQSSGGYLGGASGVTLNNITFKTTSAGNFFNSNNSNVTTDYATGTYTDVFGVDHTSLMDEVKTSLGLTTDIGTDVYKTGLVNGGFNGHTVTISGLDKNKKYVMYCGYGLKKNDDANQNSGFHIDTTGYASCGKFEYVATVASTGTKVATTYTAFSAGTDLKPGSQGLMLVRAMSIVPKSDGTIVFKLYGDRAGMNFCALAELPKMGDDYATSIDEDGGALSTAVWNPTHTGPFTVNDTITITSTVEKATFALDEDLTVAKLSGVSEAGNMLVIKRPSDLTMNVGAIDFSGAVDGIGWDATEGYAACTVLKDYYRTRNEKITFFGEGENGATLDYGTAQNNYSFAGHYIFDGGTHTFQNASESASLNFGANATEDNPTFWVKNGATLNFKSRNPCGWSAAANTDGIIRIGDESKVVLSTSASGTWYWAQRFYFEPASELEIAVDANSMALDGGVVTDKEQLYMPASEGGVATISASGAGQLRLAKDKAGAAAFVGAGSTLNVTAPLVSQNSTTTLAKTGAGTLKISGDVSGFGAPIQVKAGTLEYATATALPAAATLTVDEGATLKITADEDRAFAKTVSGSGAVVKDGAGTLTVTAGLFGDHLVSVVEGKIKFTATSAQAKEGVVLCKAATDIRNSVIVVNEEGKELSGDYTFEDNTLSFKVNCVDVSYTLEIDTDWSDVAEDLGWINSPESTLTVTCITSGAVLRFDQEIIAKSIKFVSEDGNDAIIPDGSFQNMQIASYDFTEAEGGVTISFVDLEPGELRLVTGVPIAGFANVRAEEETVPEGYGFYADASNIWLCKKIDDVTRTSPTTEDVQAFTNFFVGVKSGDWTDKANWRTAKDGLLAPYQYEKYPQSTEAQNPNWYPACFDGDVIDEYEGTKEITCAAVEGWETKLDFRNGVEVTIDLMKKFANNFMWIDNSSSVSITKLGGSTFENGYIFNVAGQLTIGTFEGNIANIPYTYNLGDEAVVTYTDGVKTGTHAINGGKLVAEGNGIAVPVTITNDVAITTPALAAVTIYPDSTLTIVGAAGGSAVTLSGAITGEGNVVFDENVTSVNFGQARPTNTFTFEGATEVIYTENIADDGVVYQLKTEGGETPTYRVFAADGTEKVIEGGQYVPSVSGKVAWYDFTFTNTLTSVGANTAKLTRDTTYGLPDSQTPYTSDGQSIFTAIDGYMEPDYPAEWSAAVFAKVPKVPNAVVMAFGTLAKGSIALIAGNTNDNEIVLARTTGNAKYEVLASMKVPNAFTASHLYSFCKSDKEIKIYLDDVLWSTYTSESAISFGKGFQLGSLHGNIGNTGFVQYGRGYFDAEVEANNSTVTALRMYKTILGPNAIKALAEEFQYESTNGTSEMTINGNLNWIGEEGGTDWTVTPFGEESYTTNAPLPGSAIAITVTGGSSITMNQYEHQNYEALTVKSSGGDYELDFITGDAGPVAPTITGLTTIQTKKVKVNYDALKFGNVVLTDDAELQFKFFGFPFDTYFSDATIPFTGSVTVGTGAQVTATDLPTEGVRTATFAQNPSSGQYELQITVEDYPFVYEDGVWAWNLEEVTAETVSNNTAQAIIVLSDLEWPIDRSGITVEAGTLTATAVTKRAADVTVEEDAVLDLNGNNAKEMSLTLNGGKVTYGDETTPTEADQIKELTLTANSEINTPVKGQIYAASYGTATTIALDAYTLTKTGTNVLQVVNTDITGTGTIDIQEGTFYGSEDTRATNVTFKIAEGASLHNRGGKTMTIAKIEGAGGTLNNEGTISTFTLTGTLNIANGGTYGTITNAAGAVVNVGTKHDLVFAGAGTVNAVLTAAEIAAEGPITIFTKAEGATTVGGTVLDEAGNEVPGVWTGGRFQVDHEAKIGTTYYLTLQDALDVGGEVVMLKSVTNEYTVAADTTVLLDFNGFAITNESRQAINNCGTLTITNGNITAQEAAIVFWGNSKTLIMGGTYEAKDNAVIMGSGNEGEGNASLVITGGTFNGGIQSAGYIACGVYVPNGGTNAISGATFNITGGCGICARAGTTQIDSDVTFNVTGSGEGKVGDKQVLIPAGVDVFFDWSEPAYPGYAEGDTIWSQSNTLKTDAGQEWSAEAVEGYYKLQKKSEKPGPTPAPGSQADVTPIAENTYVVTPTGESKDVVIQGVKSGDTLVVDGQAVDSLGVNAAEGVTVVVTTPNTETPTVPYDITAACKGWNGNEFSTELDATKSVKIGEETIPVTPTAIESTEGTVAEGAVATKAIPGLTYKLMRGTELGTYATETASAQATTTTISLKDGTTKPADKAFYVIEVTK